MKKTLIKKVKEAVNKVKESVVFDTEEKFNEFGTCIACQDGKVECLHHNQVQDGRKTSCVTCGKVLS